MLRNTLMWNKAKGNLVSLMIYDADSCPVLLLTYLQQIFENHDQNLLPTLKTELTTGMQIYLV